MLVLLFPSLLYANKIDFKMLEQESQTYYKNKEFDAFLEQLTLYARSSGKKEQAAIDYFTALTYLEKLIHLEKVQDWDKYYKIVNNYLEKARELAKQLVKRFPDEKIGLESQYLLYKIHQQQEEEGRMVQSLEKLNFMLAEYVKKTKDIELTKNIAERLYEEGKIKKATELFKSYVLALKKQKSEEELKTIADEYLEKKYFEISKLLHLEYLSLILDKKSEEFNKIASEIVKQYYSVAQEYEIKFREYSKADVIYDSFFELCQFALEHSTQGLESEYMYYVWGMGLYNILKFDEAIKVFEAFLSQYPEGELVEKAMGELGGLYFATSTEDNAEEAIKKIKRLINNYPKNRPVPEELDISFELPNLYENLGDVYRLKKGDYEEAIDAYKQVFDKYPQFVRQDLKERVKECANKLGKLEHAAFIVDFEQRQKLKQRQNEKRKTLERQKEEQKHKNFIVKMKSSAQIWSDEKDANKLLKEALVMQDDNLFKKAIEKYESLIKLYPEREKGYLERIILLYSHESLNEYNLGEKFVDRFTRLSLEKEQEYLTVVNFYLQRRINTKLNDKDEKIERLLFEILKLKPESAYAYLHLADLYFLQGKKEEAEKNFEKAKAISPTITQQEFSIMDLMQKVIISQEENKYSSSIIKDCSIIRYYARKESKKFADMATQQSEIYKDNNLSEKEKAEKTNLLVSKIIKSFPINERTMHENIYNAWSKIYESLKPIALEMRFMLKAKKLFLERIDYIELHDELQKMLEIIKTKG